MAGRLNGAVEPNAGLPLHVVLPSIAPKSRKAAVPDFPHQAGHHLAEHRGRFFERDAMFGKVLDRVVSAGSGRQTALQRLPARTRFGKEMMDDGWESENRGSRSTGGNDTTGAGRNPAPVVPMLHRGVCPASIWAGKA
jgi:hypothetical protein